MSAWKGKWCVQYTGDHEPKYFKTRSDYAVFHFERESCSAQGFT